MTRLENYHGADVFVEVIDFKDKKGNGFAVLNDDDSYTVFLNSRKSYEMQQKTLEHELRHITNHDFEKEDVQKIEAEAHQAVVKQIVVEEHEKVVKQLNEEPRLVKQEIELKEKLDEAIAEEERRRFEYEGYESFGRYMWTYHQEEFFRLLEAQKLYGGI